jgi:hypothetical protein
MTAVPETATYAEGTQAVKSRHSKPSQLRRCCVTAEMMVSVDMFMAAGARVGATPTCIDLSAIYVPAIENSVQLQR